MRDDDSDDDDNGGGGENDGNYDEVVDCEKWEVVTVTLIK